MTGTDDGDDEEEELSDYIDENFEMDETDEYWGVSQHVAHQLSTQENNLIEKTRSTLHLRDDPRIKFEAGYRYADDELNEQLRRDMQEVLIEEEERSRNINHALRDDENPS